MMKTRIIAAGAMCAASLAAGSASAMPVGGLQRPVRKFPATCSRFAGCAARSVASGVPGLASMAGPSIGTMASMDGRFAITGDRDFMRVPGGVVDTSYPASGIRRRSLSSV